MLKRSEILDATYNLMLKKGYEDTSIQDIIDKINATKGCLYYHFKSKRDIAAAVIQEIIKPAYVNTWGDAYKAKDPISELCFVIDKVYGQKAEELAETGCPLGNLVLELSAKDKVLSKHVNEIMILWQSFIEKAIETAKSSRIIRQDLNAKNISGFITGSFEGCIMLSKSSHSKAILEDCFSTLKDYLNSLRTDGR
ncbi:MAG: TetR/AcrR family transcriptional regulator [Deltaproteobacteria bacterium]|nr:TetR/AcrR family transcriptional regulator [Deltaproteobacteria bacterium]MCL5880060.1 TetR/AcrR family transcriptional regulator [Deltaproteobacteria bacterium]MDA8304505.1 TetR/AcrR family transcriptional regulator [Deltaproteobacteria bacterium]